MTLFRQGKTSPKSSKALKLPSVSARSEAGGSQQRTSHAIATTGQDVPALPQHEAPARGYSTNSVSSSDSGISSSAPSSSSSSSGNSINGLIGLQGATVRQVALNESSTSHFLFSTVVLNADCIPRPSAQSSVPITSSPQNSRESKSGSCLETGFVDEFRKPADSSLRLSPTSLQRPPLVGSAPSESGNTEAAIPQVSRYGRVLPSTHELRGQGATLPCLAYGEHECSIVHPWKLGLSLSLLLLRHATTSIGE